MGGWVDSCRIDCCRFCSFVEPLLRVRSSRDRPNMRRERNFGNDFGNLICGIAGIAGNEGIRAKT